MPAMVGMVAMYTPEAMARALPEPTMAMTSKTSIIPVTVPRSPNSGHTATSVLIIKSDLWSFSCSFEISRRRIPLLNALCRRPAAIADAAARCAARIGEQLGNMVTVGTIEVSGEIGGGSLPGITYPSHAVTLAHAEMGVDKLAAVLRAAKSPVIGRIQDDQLLLDLRAIMEEDEEEFVRTVIVAIGGD